MNYDKENYNTLTILKFQPEKNSPAYVVPAVVDRWTLSLMTAKSVRNLKLFLFLKIKKNRSR